METHDTQSSSSKGVTSQNQLRPLLSPQQVLKGKELRSLFLWRTEGTKITPLGVFLRVSAGEFSEYGILGYAVIQRAHLSVP